jgi:formylmethanofuran dehydrogenase subunit C
VVLVLIAVAALLGCVAVSFDVGRVVLAAQRCQDLADAAALGAVNEFPSRSYLAASQRIADVVSANNVTPGLTITSSSDDAVYYAAGDVVPGWGQLPASDEAALVQTHAYVPFFFASALGLDGTSVTRRATALIRKGESIACIFAHGSPGSDLYGLTVNGSGSVVYNGNIWSNSDITYNGSHQTVQGDAHADTSFVVNGSWQTITGRAEWVTSWTLNGSHQSMNPIQVATEARDYPVTYTVDDFGPYTYDVPSLTINGANQAVPPGIYRVRGDVVLNGSNISLAGVTFVADGRIVLNGSRYGPASPAAANGVLFWSNSTSSSAITINGASGDWSGTIFAPRGGLVFNGSNQCVSRGSLLAERITVNGSGFQIFPTEGAWGEVVRRLIG